MKERRLNLQPDEAAQLASEAVLNGDADSLLLFLIGIREKESLTDIEHLIVAARDEILKYGSTFSDVRDDYLTKLVKKFRKKGR